MAHDPRDTTANRIVDDNERLQEELRRESNEHAELGGDTEANRNLGGSSTWTTLPPRPDEMMERRDLA